MNNITEPASYRIISTSKCIEIQLYDSFEISRKKHDFCYQRLGKNTGKSRWKLWMASTEIFYLIINMKIHVIS
jgi:hypothetical protein